MSGFVALVLALIGVAITAIAIIVTTVPVPSSWIWHAGLMFMAWGVLIPTGGVIARFSKVTPGQDWPHVLDNKVWWHAHLICQYSAVAMISLAAAMMVQEGGLHVGNMHARLGIGAVFLSWIQVIGGWLRGSKGGPTEPDMRGDHYDMTLRRQVFEAVHKPLGWLSLAIAAGAIHTGLTVVGAPSVVHALNALSFGIVAMAFVAFSRTTRRIKTYQAIWGPAPSHPGNRDGAAPNDDATNRNAQQKV